MKPEMKTIELELTRTIPASPIEVFDGWLDPQCPGTPWNESAKLILDPKLDGLYYWLFVNEAGEPKPHYGGRQRSSIVHRRFNTRGCHCIREASNRW